VKGNSDPMDLSAVKEDISNLRSDMKVLFQKLIDTGKSETGAAKERVIEELHDALELASKSGKETVESLESKVQENPFTSLLLAFFVGLLLGVFLNRK
jgi:ElaB/YqjD/DUF883 family membrane-anchored ribosome-binding protein